MSSAATAIRTSRSASSPIAAASTFKAAILLTAYQQRDAGLLDFDKVVTLEDKYTQYDLGTLDGLGLRTNDQVTVRDALKGMIVVSDTSLAALMQDKESMRGRTAAIVLTGGNVDSGLYSTVIS